MERISHTEPKLCHHDYNLAKKWFVYFDITDNLTGETKRPQFRANINSCKTKDDRIRQGNALIAYWKEELRDGWNPFVPVEELEIINPTLIGGMETILELKERTNGKRTQETYRHIIRTFITWLRDRKLSELRISKFNQFQGRAYADYLIKDKGYQGRTFNDHITILNTFFNCAVDRDWVDRSPFRKVKKLPVEVGRNIAFTIEERERLTAYLYLHDRDMYYFTQFVYYCFIRRSELTRLKICNIDFKSQSIIVPSGASKNRKQESVVIPAPMIEVMTEMNIAKLPAEYFIFGRGLRPGPDQYINYNHISSRHNQLCKKQGISTQKGLYSWKHTGVCELYRRLNGDMYSLMRQLRHTELTTTQIYLKSLGLVDNSAVRNVVW